MPRGISLHIGLSSVDPDHYAGWSGPLNACEADAADMQRLMASLGYETESALTKRATRDSIMARIAGASRVLAPGDIFCLTYSGHGGRWADDDELDGEAKTWCLYDGQLAEHELFALFALFAEGVRVLVLSDSCHTGTVVRKIPRGRGFELVTTHVRSEGLAADEPRYRVAPSDVLLKTFRLNRTYYERAIARLPTKEPEVRASVRVISGCQDNQLAADGVYNGLFTGMLLRVWNDGRFAGSYRELHSAIVRRMPSDQTPNHDRVGVPDAVYDAQRPFAIA